MRLAVHRSTYLILSIALVVTLMLACHRMPTTLTASGQHSEPCRTVKHKMGQTCIPLHPQRIITLWNGTLGSVWALGIRPIASTWIPGQPFPAYLQDVDGVEFVGTVNEPNLEKIVQLNPDLILSNTRLQQINDQLSKIAPTVVMDLPSPPLSWQQNLVNAAQVFDRKQESKHLIAAYWQRIEQIRQTLGDRRLQKQISVAALFPGYGILAYGEKHPVGILLKDIGLKRPPSQTGDFDVTSTISEENLLDIDADVLFLSSFGGEAGKQALEKLQQRPLWQKLKAVQQNQVYLVDSDHWYAFDVLAMNAVLDDIEKSLLNTP
jgi:iron complex transport system substrate-binding protein